MVKQGIAFLVCGLLALGSVFSESIRVVVAKPLMWILVVVILVYVVITIRELMKLKKARALIKTNEKGYYVEFYEAIALYTILAAVVIWGVLLPAPSHAVMIATLLGVGILALIWAAFYLFYRPPF